MSAVARRVACKPVGFKQIWKRIDVSVRRVTGHWPD
jgi:hypothetical protein